MSQGINITKRLEYLAKKCVWGGYLEDHPVCEVHAPPRSNIIKHNKTQHIFVQQNNLFIIPKKRTDPLPIE